MRSEMSGRVVEPSRTATGAGSSHPSSLPPAPALPDLPTCESCGLRPGTLVWIDTYDLMGFHVCPTCHPDWRDR